MTHDLSRGQAHGLRLASEHFARGQYVAQLRLLFAHVDPDRTLVLQYERCIEDPATEIARTYAFLGLDPAHRPNRLLGAVNATRFDKHPLTDHDRRSLARAYAAEFDELEHLCPSVDTSLWTSTLAATTGLAGREQSPAQTVARSPLRRPAESTDPESTGQRKDHRRSATRPRPEDL